LNLPIKNGGFSSSQTVRLPQPGHRVTCRTQGRQFTTGHARGRGCIALVLALLNWLPQALYGLFYGKSPTRMDELWIIGLYLPSGNLLYSY